jgi:tetratricopeptide (TPR) repeat protein
VTVLAASPVSAADLSELASLGDDAARSAFLARHTEFNDPAIVEQIADAVREQVRVDVHKADALADGAVLIARGLNCPATTARALRAKANAKWHLNELKSAVDLFDQAIELFDVAGDRGELGRTLSSSIQSLILLGEYARAMAAADRAREIFEALGDDRRLARLDINVANILHRQDRLAEALDAYERAYTRLLPYQDAEAIGVALHNQAVCLIVLNDFDRALATYERAREHCAQAGMPVLVAQADYNIAYLYYFRGDYSRALELLRAARTACTTVGDPYHSALCNLDQSEIYLDLNLSAEAAEMAQEGQAAFERLGNGYEAARCVTNLAIALGQQGELFRALELFADARSRFQREQNAVWPFVIDLYQALVLFNTGRFFEARRLCVSALAFFRGARLHRKAILSELLLARVELSTGQPRQALQHCEQAIRDTTTHEAGVLEYQAHFLNGEIHEALGSPECAYQSYCIARERLETIRSVLWGDDLKIAFMKTKLAVYERLVDLCLARSRGTETREIFEYVEQAKSRSLRDLFAQCGSGATSEDPSQSELVRQIRTLREELNWYYHRVEVEQLHRDERSADRLEHLQAQLRSREHSFIRILRDMPQGSRELVGLSDSEAASPEKVRSILQPGTAIVEYFITGDRILAVVLNAEELTVVPLTTVSRVQHVLRLLQFQLSKFQLGPEYVAKAGPALFKSTNTHLQELYDEFMAPLALPLSGHLVIVPHDLLHYVPFHALHDGQSYVADTHTVSYAPSASIYALCCERPRVAGDRSLILGVPDERAPLIDDEVRAMPRLLPNADLRVGPLANLDALRELGSTSKVVHIATHGYFREDNPLFSGVRLGDSFLTVQDIYDLRLPVDLITLSGCGTGLNVVAAGDELRGLVRGLLAAGARSALLSLWDVHDRSTATLMTSFYEGLNAGLSKAVALQRAMALLRSAQPHPYFWAPFVLIGADGITG